MANYSEWNTQIANYFINNAQEGSGVYLSVNEDVLADIGIRMTEPIQKIDAVRDFESAVRSKVIGNNGHVNLSKLLLDSNGVPQGVAFLAAQVLAAYRMAEDISIDANNYFERLNALLGIQSAGRPSGMHPASENEAPLWQMWADWLLIQGYLPTAEPGVGPTEYINLPISQSLIRQSDEDKLSAVFKFLGNESNPDADTLFYHVLRHRSTLSTHLRDLLNDPSTRYESLTDEIYTSWLDWKQNGPRSIGITRERIAVTTISLKLYRTDDPIDGIEYYLYPEIPRSFISLEGISARIDEHYTEPLRSDRPGWWAPLGKVVTSNDLDGLELTAEGDPSLNKLRLEHRNFWILVHDQDDPGSGVRASWRRPTLGEPFTLLFRDTLLPELVLLKDERLIAWDGIPAKSPLVGWSEISNCSAISTIGWAGVFGNNSDLIQALQPRDRISIGLSGGLRLTAPVRWLASHPPTISVVSPTRRIILEVTDVFTKEKIFSSSPNDFSVDHTLQPTEWLNKPGTYLITARPNLGEAVSLRRTARLVGWDEIVPAIVTDPITVPLTNPWTVNGALLTNMEDFQEGT